MLKKMSVQLAVSLVHLSIIKLEDEKVYAYGLELVLAAVFNILLLIIISIVLGHPFAWLLFLLPFIPIRLTAGGYHTQGHLTCFILFTCVFTILLLISTLLAGYFTILALLTISCISSLFVILLSPLAARNKPMSEYQKKTNRNKSIIFSLISVLLTAVYCFLDAKFILPFVIFVMGQAGASISLIVVWIINKFDKSHETIP